MNLRISVLASPTGMLYQLVILGQLISGFYMGREIDMPGNVYMLYWISLLWVIGYWLLQDNRKHHISWMHDMGLLLYLAWPLVLPIYLFQTRRVGALRPIGIFVAVFALSTLIGSVIGTVWNS